MTHVVAWRKRGTIEDVNMSSQTELQLPIFNRLAAVEFQRLWMQDAHNGVDGALEACRRVG